MLETLSYTLIGIGLAFDLLGCIGLVRLPDVYNRAQAATKCVTLGTCLIVIGTAGIACTVGNVSMAVKAVICATFILLTSPCGAHAVCRGAYISGVPLWKGSVEDAFVTRADAIREEQTRAADEKAQKEAAESEKA